MQGYDAQKALAYVRRAVNPKQFRELGASVDGYLQQAQEWDLRFMRETGVLDAEGYAGDAAYDEDEAMEYILEGIVSERGLDEEAAIVVASLVNVYLSAHDAFLHQEGLA